MNAEVIWGQDRLLFDGELFLGCLNCSEYSADSVCNEHGIHGGKYHSNSIWNEYGTYGNSHSSSSPWNKYSSSGPKIADRQGNDYGRFAVNSYSVFSQSSKLKERYDAVDGDLDKVRDLFCR